MRRVLHLLSILCLSNLLIGQERESFWQINGQLHYNYVVKNHPKYPKLNWAQGGGTIELAIVPKAYWSELYHFPQVGVQLSFNSFGNHYILGEAYGAIAFMQLQPFKSKQLNLKFGSGLAWLTKKHHPYENLNNVAISTHLNNLSIAEISYLLNTKGQLTTELILGVSHFSNAKFSVPNAGINALYAGLNIGRKFKRTTPQAKPIGSKQLNYKIHLEGRIGLGFTDTKLKGGRKTYVYVIDARASKTLSFTNKLHLGIEYYFDEGVYNFIEQHEIFDNAQNQAQRWVLNAGHTFLFGKLGLLTEGGIYLNKGYLVNSLFSTRLGFECYAQNPAFDQRHNFFGGVYVKSELGEASFLEFGLGYVF